MGAVESGIALAVTEKARSVYPVIIGIQDEQGKEHKIKMTLVIEPSLFGKTIFPEDNPMLGQAKMQDLDGKVIDVPNDHETTSVIEQLKQLEK